MILPTNRCPNCGADNRERAAFCSLCGAALPAKEETATLRVDRTRIRLHPGEVTALEVDAIVNPTDPGVGIGSGIGRAIADAAGPEFEAAVSKVPRLQPGQAVATRGGKLKVKYVIHAAVLGEDGHTNLQHIKAATHNALRVCEDLGLRTVAFPALTTGVGGQPPAAVARIMLDVVRQHAHGPTGLAEVVFTLPVDKLEIYQAFAGELALLRGQQPAGPCPSCGTVNRPEARFCAGCGQRL